MLAELAMLVGQRLGKPPGYERLIRMIWSPAKCREMQPRLITLRGEPLFLADPRTLIGWHVLFFGTYEAELRSFLLSYLQPGYVAVDVGANVGWHTLLMAAKVGRRGSVLAFEPNPRVRQVLVQHLELNRLSRVQVLPYALIDQNKAVGFVSPPADDLGSGDGFVVQDQKRDDPSMIQVEGRAFDSLLPAFNLQRLDFVKMDIEGYEYQALVGMRLTIERFRPVIALEFDASYVGRCGASREAIGQLLEECSYQPFVICRGGLKECSYPSWPSCCDLVAIPSQRC
jgi:FkbM family methyltransferase